MKSPLADRAPRRGTIPTGLLIAVTGLLGLALGGAFQLVRDGVDSAASERARARLDEKAREAGQRLTALLSGHCLLDAPPASVPAGTPGGVWFRSPTASPRGPEDGDEVSRLRFELDLDELADGLDDDGDGLVDEGCIVLTRDPGGPRERSAIVCRGVCNLLDGELLNGRDDNGNGAVDEPGFHVTVDGRLAEVHLTLQAADPAGGVVRSHVTALATTRLAR